MIKRFAFWAMFPFVVPQAILVRKRAPRFDGASGRNRGVVGTGDRTRLLAIGDSVIAGVGAATFENALVGNTALAVARRFDVSVEWTALGKIGAPVGQVYEDLLPRVPKHKYDIMVVSVGVNDVTGLKRSAVFRSELQALLAALHAHSPNAQIVVLGMPPMRSFPLLPRPLRWILGLRGRTLDQIIQQVAAEQPGAYCIPLEIEPDPSMFAADGYHPSEASCADLGELIGETLLPVGRQPAATTKSPA